MINGLYINIYVARIIQEFLRRQPFCINPIIENPDAWVLPENIHRHFEKPTPRMDEGTASESQRRTPLIEVKCHMANPCSPRNMGNWDLAVEICITNDTQNATDEDHESRVNDVMAVLYQDELVQNLISIQPKFFCPRVVPGTIEDHIEGQSMSTTARFTFLACCAQDCR